MKKLFLLVIAVGLLLILISIFYWDGTAPQVEKTQGDRIGRDQPIHITVSDSGKGLRSLSIRILQDGREFPVMAEDFGTRWLPWQQGPVEQEVTITPPAIEEAELEEGPFQVEVEATQQSNFFFSSPAADQTFELEYDVTPPRIEVVSGPHYLRQGGSEAAVYRIEEGDVRSGVQVGERRFEGVPLPQGQPGAHVVLFALSHDQPTDSPVHLWAVDAAGNTARAGLDVRIFRGRFRERTINVDDRFINRVSPEILSRSDGVEAGSTPKETYVAINRDLRVKNNARIEEITEEVTPRRLWEQPFLQLSNSQVEASFADYRTYRYQGEEIDRQTHLGFDLASLAQSPVEASNSGVVAFADYLGIYGNCVIVDHGLGLYSLYGHLSQIGVEPGQRVERGQELGNTGQTGLAGGDHLHFSMVLQGVQVNPIEWWDPKWVEDHLTARLQQVDAETRLE